MRTISRTTRFKKDYKREAKGQHQATLDVDLIAVLTLLANNIPLAPSLGDPALTGNGKITEIATSSLIWC